MLHQLLQNAAAAYESTQDERARLVAEKLSAIDVPDNWKITGNLQAQSSLDECLTASDCHPAVTVLGDIAPNLSWVSAYDFKDHPADFSGSYCFTRLIGPEGLIDADDFRFGLFLQEPYTNYPSHKHEAEELYLPVSGTAAWQKDDAPYENIKTGTLIHHLPYQPHATRTGDAPLLAFWAWLGNLCGETYSFVIP